MGMAIEENNRGKIKNKIRVLLVAMVAESHGPRSPE